MSPLISIITVVRNAEQDIEETIESVRRLKSPQVEYIVIDGNSTDRTWELVKCNADIIDIMLRESDTGIYDAMNKAAKRATGEFLLHINAGDKLIWLPENILRALPADCAVASFPVQLSSGAVHLPSAGPWLSLNNTLHHQGSLYRRRLVPAYDLSYRTFADFDLNQRLRGAIEVFPSTKPVAHHRQDGRSHDYRNFHEVYTIVQRHHGRIHVAACWLLFKWRGMRGRLKSLIAS